MLSAEAANLYRRQLLGNRCNQSSCDGRGLSRRSDRERHGFVGHPQNGVLLRLITRESVQSFLTKKLRTGLSWKTVKHIRTTFGTILGAAEADDLLSDNPVHKTRFPRRGPISEKASIAPEKLLELLHALPEPSQSLAWLLALTGLRIGELLALRWRDVDLEIGCVRVRQTVYEGRFDDPKTRRSRRTVPLGTGELRF